MLQRGIETPDMDVRWVSSLSWYFLNFFGLNGLYRIILGGDNCKPACEMGLGICVDILFSCRCLARHGRIAVQCSGAAARTATRLQ